ncbi:multicopper oxidase [Aplosporella prunicola CBS 121167]|uniref:Multicopper oxidase n=1 Tax=Aplosporella prunicola CBS 121167 TaxID=1176127 RepID=A0A6A6BBN8_9PEZI|nr:multicopper oxidase [Aplosporella prunicola CBS 121167]KAF2141018.1 multicopper oxidase [Aplosporella prunicola CBS 121167]
MWLCPCARWNGRDWRLRSAPAPHLATRSLPELDSIHTFQLAPFCLVPSPSLLSAPIMSSPAPTRYHALPQQEIHQRHLASPTHRHVTYNNYQRWFNFSLLVLFLEFGLLIVVVAVALLAIFAQVPSRNVIPSGGPLKIVPRPSNSKYILDPNWDVAAAVRTREYHWIIQDAERNPDGVYRPMILINGEFPGPLIECNQGDTITVYIENQSTNSTSFHWHGIYQNGSNWMDGTAGITQCPVASGSSMTYNFTIDGQAGTYWYHAHMTTQGSDGLAGPFIIHSKNERDMQQLQYATDQVIMIQDYYHDLTSALLPHYLAPDRENAEPVPDGGLINGKNVRNCDTLLNRRCDNSTSSLSVFELDENKKHRLRIINTGAFAEFQVQIDEHEFAVTEADGTDLWPTYHHRLNISPGQRYSIVLTTNVSSAGFFWMRAKMVTACFAEENLSLASEVRAIVAYKPAKDSNRTHRPSSIEWGDPTDMQCLDMNATELRPVVSLRAPSAADTLIHLRSNFEIGSWRLSRGYFNSSSWRPNFSSPSLYRLVSGHQSKNSSFINSMSVPYGINSEGFDTTVELVYQTTGIRTVDILVSNFDDGSHPLHMHGYKFFVLSSGHGYPPVDLMQNLDLSNPLRRDTASVEAFGWILLRFVADNPGIWAFHCHFTWHTEAGMLMQFATRADEMATFNVPDEHHNMCEAKGLNKGAAPDDSTWFGDFGNFHQGDKSK